MVQKSLFREFSIPILNNTPVSNTILYTHRPELRTSWAETVPTSDKLRSVYKVG